jgi:rare lipoprotein A (peptidoglycan hydrolase)
LSSVGLASQLVRYQSAPTTPTTAPASIAPPAAPVSFESNESQSAAVEQASVPVTTTTTAPPVTAPPVTAPPVTAPTAPAVTDSEHGEATWYAEAPPGRCASPTLPFGTVLVVTNDATGASVTCVVDDREEAGYPRVVDLSPSGFAQLADPSAGVVDVTISW